MWGRWKRLFQRRQSVPPDPLAAFDAALFTLERRGAEVRKAAATLLALRSELTHRVEQLSQKLRALELRAQQAERSGDTRALSALHDDEAQERRLLATAEEALVRSEMDCGLLTEAARELRDRQERLETERAAARAQLRAGLAQVSVGVLEGAAEWAHSVQLEQARDEVERAHALAEIYREAQRERQG